MNLQQVPEEVIPEKEAPVESKEEVSPTPATGEAPRFITELTKTVAKHGQQVQMVCIVIGTPTPTIRWILDGEIIPEDSTTYITEYHKDGTCILTIKETVQEDEGEYTVEATNDFGIVRSTAELVLEGRFDNYFFDNLVFYSITMKTLSL